MISEELKNDLKIKWDRMRDGMAKMGMDACLLTVDDKSIVVIFICR